MTTQIHADLREIRATDDANGNVASITPPTRPLHLFDYTPVDLEARYTRRLCGQVDELAEFS